VSGDAEPVALRVGPLDIPLILVVNDGGAEPHQSFDFGGSIVSPEVERNIEGG